MVKISSYFSKEGLGVLCLMIPLVMKWLLPPGLETKLYFEGLGSVNIFLPNILLLFTPFLFSKNKKATLLQKILFVLWFLLEIFVVLVSDSNAPLSNILSNFFLSGALYLGFFRKTTERQVIMIKPFMVISCVLVALQFIILSTGLVYYDLDDSQEFGGVIRVYSTAGDGTGAGALVALFGIMCFYILKSVKMKIAIGLIALVAVFFTVSRSPIAFLVITIAFIFWKYIRIRAKSIFYALFIVLILYNVGVFNPIIERQKIKSESGDYSSGRNERQEKVLRDVHIQRASMLGLGVGNVYATTEVVYSKVKVPYEGAPHNSYILLYGEQGIIGIVFLFFMLAVYFIRNYKRNPDFIVILGFLACTVLVTETTIVTNSDYVFLLALFMMMINSDHKYLALPIHNSKKMKYEKNIIRSNN